jgi:hypothetical protein
VGGDVDIAFVPEQAVQRGMRSSALLEERAALDVASAARGFR